ncbi:ThuA domain-containing protein [Piscinibacter koreensis]|uniref:ThuA domain-containing protein n=1 Tax=Piscinibacter koreensis TaxID=2742824 RepID=A0A7Y6NRP9_9BURK|nr:ThuA domain-containing protein [Schlegelella koreensis]NUZ08064.1 ThuA domain-containing protein [Schlegelella koreensis]
MTTTTVKTLAAGALAALAGGAFAQAAGTQGPINSNLPNGAPAAAFDTTYNVCRGVYPQCYNDMIQRTGNTVLIYSRTAGPRHANLGPALAAGINRASNPTAGPQLTAANVAQLALREWLAAEGIQADITEDASQMPGLGSNYKAVIFMSPTRDTMTLHGKQSTITVNTSVNASIDAPKTNLRQYIRSGGGFVGIHNAFGTEYNWPWYEGLLGNANFYDHGANQPGTVVTVQNDPSTQGLPATWPHQDEFYNLMPYPTKVKFLTRVDENTLAVRRTTHPGHGNFHPNAWCQYYDGGRSWVTTMGHDSKAFQDGSGFPGQQEFKRLVVQGIKSAMGLTPFCN